jgi:6-pyruvoyltetrahydropterin/6-carboxytetrahydropterin synthase
MLIDLSHLRHAIAQVRDQLDHRYLNEVEGLAAPTIENLCRYIITSMRALVPTVSKVSVARRASGDRCSVTLDSMTVLPAMNSARPSEM